jgi:hypothetical protein
MDYNTLTKEKLIELLIIDKTKKELASARTLQWVRENQEARLYQSCRNNSIKRNLEFSISQEDIIIPEVCPILDVKLTNISGQGRVKTNASIDRMDNSKGYTKDNILVVSDLANRMKQNATTEELLAFAKGIINLYDRKTNT